MNTQTTSPPSGLASPPCSLVLGDCLDVMKKIPSGSVDMVCADLPYGTTACVSAYQNSKARTPE